MVNAILDHESFVMLNGFHLTGVDSVSISSRNSHSVVSPIGTQMGLTVPTGPTEQSMSLSRYLIYEDPIYNVLGKDKLIVGEVHDDSNNSYYGFQSGYIRSYSVNCAVGSFPKVNVGLGVLDEIVSGVNRKKNGDIRNGPRKKNHPVLEGISQKTISINCEDFQDNKVVGFDYSVGLDYDVYYGIGSTHPYDIKQKRPIRYSASVQLELGQSYNTQTFDFLNNRENKDISMEIQGKDGSTLNYLNIPNASLVGRNLSQSANGTLSMNLSYVGHLGADNNFLP